MGKYRRKILVLSQIILASFIVGLGQGCSKNFSFVLNGEPENKASNSSGNGVTYDGKLVFLHLENNFTCENKTAPQSMLYRDDSGKWFITINEPDKCASVSMQPISGIVYENGNSSLVYDGRDYSLDPKFPDISTGLSDYPVSFKVVASADPESIDINPGDNICANSLGLCSLRASIDELNSIPNRPAIINLEAGTYKITKPLSTKVNSIVILKGQSAVSTSIDGQNSTNILEASYWRTNKLNATVSVEDISFVNGYSPNNLRAAAITNDASLNVKNCLFTGNQAVYGTIYTSVYADGGSTNILLSAFQNNNSAGVRHFGNAKLKIQKSTFTNNSFTAGLLINSAGSGVTVEQSLFSQNKSGIYSAECAGTCTFVNNTITQNDNAGLIITAYTHTGTYQINNNTIYKNSTSAASFGNLELDIADLNSTQVTVKNSILAPTANGTSSCKYNPPSSAKLYTSYSIIDDASCSPNGGSNLSTDPLLLEPLANNGGPTLTLALQSGSPAIDAGDNLSCESVDQRGQARPVDKLGMGAICDIGAFEAQ